MATKFNLKCDRFCCYSMFGKCSDPIEAVECLQLTIAEREEHIGELQWDCVTLKEALLQCDDPDVSTRFKHQLIKETLANVGDKGKS